MYDIEVHTSETTHRLYNVVTSLNDIYNQARNGDPLLIETTGPNNNEISMIPWLNVEWVVIKPSPKATETDI